MATISAPDGPLFDLKFEDLNYDCLFEILKYLPFKEKIRYQRVGRRWGELLKRIWTKQGVLGFNRNPSYFGDQFCARRGHSLRGSDVVLTKSTSLEEEKETWDRLTSKCDRLKAVVWLTERPEELLPLLSNCTRLEHLDICSREVKHLVPFVERGAFARLKCLDMVLTNDHESGVDVLKLVRNSPQLEALSIRIQVERQDDREALTTLLVDILTTVLPHLILLHVMVHDYECMRMGPTLLEAIANLGKGIETLSYEDYGNHPNDDAFDDDPKPEADLLRLLVDKMPKLKSVTYIGYVENMRHVMASDILQHISWNNMYDVNFEFPPLIGPKPKLKTLKLPLMPLNDNNWEQLMKIPEYYPNLEVLDMSFTPDTSEPDPLADRTVPLHPFPPNFFLRLKRLKKLRLEACHLRDEDVQFCLDNCPKLRKVNISDCRLVSHVVLTSIADYALLHSEREVVVYLDLERKLEGDRRLFPSNLKISGDF